MSKIKTKFITKEKFPLVIEPAQESPRPEEFLTLIDENNEYFRNQLLKYGAILFRNFPVHNEHDFSKVIKRLNLGKFLDYIGGDSPRNKITEGIYTSTEAPPSIKIPLHNELSFVNNHPKHIYFYCQIAPQKDGETIIGDARKIYAAVDEKIRQRFNEKRLKYVSCYYQTSFLIDLINKIQKSHKTWLDVFETDCKMEVERKCRENDFTFKWNQNNWIQLSQVRPATMQHPITQEQCWFNQAHLFDFNPKLIGWWRYLGAKLLYCREHMRLHEIFFADNSKVPRQDLYHIMDVLDENTVAFPWQKGDVLILDNILAMHGRAPFTGKRRVLAAMTG